MLIFNFYIYMYNKCNIVFFKNNKNSAVND